MLTRPLRLRASFSGPRADTYLLGTLPLSRVIPLRERLSAVYCRCRNVSFPCDSAHLPDRFQWVSQVHQECPTADKVRPAVFNGNVVGVTFTESDLPWQPFLLSLSFSGADVGGPNVHSNDGTFSKYEAG